MYFSIIFLHELNGLQIQTSGFDFQVSSLQRLLFFPNSINACCTERFVYSAMQLFFQNNYSGNMCNVSLCHCTAKAFINNVLLHAIVQLINLSAQ